VRPKVVKSVHYCPATKKTIERKYTDLTSLDPFPSAGVYPTKVVCVCLFVCVCVCMCVCVCVPLLEAEEVCLVVVAILPW